MRIGDEGPEPEELISHLRRLESGAASSTPWLMALSGDLARWAGRGPAALRLALDPIAGALWARREPLPATPRPYRLHPMPHPLPFLDHPRAKGMDGRWETAPLQAARAAGAEDALLLWPGGTLAETAIAAIGVELAGALVLPPPAGRVESLGERLQLPRWAEARGLRIEIRALTLPEARHGRLWCVNALRGVWDAGL